MKSIASDLCLAFCLLPALLAAQTLPFDAREATISSVQHALLSGLNSCRDVTLSFLARIRALNPQINTIISLDPTALAQATALDDALARGNTTGSLFCVPILLKDNFDTADLPTTGGCIGLASSRPLSDAPTVTALKRAGAVILGKTNMHELALEGLTVSSLGGQTLNPYDLSRTPGGSSGGSAAAVAASLAVLATGSDTVNSLRRVIPISYTQDAVGIIGRTVRDVATAMTVMQSVGLDPQDNATALVPSDVQSVDCADGLEDGELKGLRFGVLEGFFNRTASEETTPVNEAMASIIEMLRKAGAVAVPIQESIYNATAILQNLTCSALSIARTWIRI